MKIGNPRTFTRLSIFLLPISIAACGLDAEGTYREPGSGGAGGAGTGAGGVGGAGGAGGAGTGAGGSVGPEDCINDADDNGNGKIDCADALCTTEYECTAAIPTGFSLVSVSQGPFPAMMPATCSDGSLPIVYYSEPATTADCAACTSCGYAGVKCSAPGIACAVNAGACTTANEIKLNDTNCMMDIPSATGDGRCQLSSAPSVIVGQSTCTNGSTELVGPPMWGHEVYVCPVQNEAGAGCQDGACVPKNGDVIMGDVCIVKDGADMCPAGWTAQKIDAFEGGSEGRSCTGCTCDVKTASCTNGSVTLYDYSDCTVQGAGSTTFNTLAACQTLSGYFENYGYSLKGTLGDPVPGTCSAPAGTGSVNTNTPHTICCR